MSPKKFKNVIPKALNDLNSIIKTLSNDHQNYPFYLHEINADDVLKTFKSLRNDCSTGYDNMPVSLMKPIAGYIASSLAYIINNHIKT